MSTIQIRLYDIFRKDLKLQEPAAKGLVEVIQNVVEEKQADKHKHMEQMVQKDIKLLKDHMDNEFGRMREYMDHEFDRMREYMVQEFGYMRNYSDTKFATKEELASVKADLSKTIYFVSLAQVVAIIASLISIIMILRK